MTTGANPKSVNRCDVQVAQGVQPVESDPAETQLQKCMLEGTQEGKEVRILKDSACTQTAVKASLVPAKCYLPGKHVTLRGIGGHVTVPLALVDLNCAVVSGKVIVAALDGLERDVLL